MQQATRVIKKYTNRRLYDTEESRYVTIDELTETIRAGRDVRVVDAQSGADLTQVTLTQAILEGRGAAKLLPVPLLLRLIRLKDDALGEFLGRYMALALESYLQLRSGARTISAYNPFATVPFNAASTFARMFSELAGWNDPRNPSGAWNDPRAAQPSLEPEERPIEPSAPERSAKEDDVSVLRREIDELKELVRSRVSRPENRRSNRKKKTKPSSNAD
ncbi:MAG: hypothetical protein HYV07_18680 [Deltaproteobacteria bacterium]|nr:hypothetical protein [Deltaproteobacteria bacterium]